MARRRILVAPLGITPTAAYTAVLNSLPSHVFVIPSRDAAPDGLEKLRERLAEMGLADIVWRLCPFPTEWKGLPTTTELASAIAGEIRPLLPGEIVYNIGGGSAAVQLVIAAIYFIAGGARYASIDPREPAERRAQPFFAADWVRVDFG
jgi:hypothetical protein